MGFMAEGDTLSWSEAQRVLEYVKTHGIAQFLAIYRAKQAHTNAKLLWGDEVEVSVGFRVLRCFCGSPVCLASVLLDTN